MRTKQLVVWVTVYLAAAVFLASGAEYGDRLAVASQQYEQRQIPNRWEELRRRVKEVQDDPIVYPMRPMPPRDGRAQPIADCINLFRVGKDRLGSYRTSQCLKLLSSRSGN